MDPDADAEYFSDSDNENDIDEPETKVGKKKREVKPIDSYSDVDDDDGDDISIQSNDENEEEEEEEDGENDEDDEEFARDEDEKIAQNFPEIESEGEDEEEEEDEDYLKKFDENLQKTIIQDYHPELHVHNYEEIDSLCTIVRDKNGIIVDPLHRTIPFVSRYETARILGERAKQLNSGAISFIEIKDEELIDGYLIALEEFKQKKIPFIIQRPLPNGGCEYWRVKDLEVI